MREIGAPERNSGQTKKVGLVEEGHYATSGGSKLSPAKMPPGLVVEGQAGQKKLGPTVLHKDPWECGVGLAPPVSLNVAHLIGSQLQRAT